MSLLSIRLICALIVLKDASKCISNFGAISCCCCKMQTCFIEFVPEIAQQRPSLNMLSEVRDKRCKSLDVVVLNVSSTRNKYYPFGVGGATIAQWIRLRYSLPPGSNPGCSKKHFRSESFTISSFHNFQGRRKK